MALLRYVHRQGQLCRVGHAIQTNLRYLEFKVSTCIYLYIYTYIYIYIYTLALQYIFQSLSSLIREFDTYNITPQHILYVYIYIHHLTVHV